MSIILNINFNNHLKCYLLVQPQNGYMKLTKQKYLWYNVNIIC